jgi:hypothetical protein
MKTTATWRFEIEPAGVRPAVSLIVAPAHFASLFTSFIFFGRDRGGAEATGT